MHQQHQNLTMARRWQLFLLRLVALTIFGPLVEQSIATSDITTFNDAECTNAQSTFSGPNGYPDMTCTRFSSRVSSNYSSFQVGNLDPGCAGKQHKQAEDDLIDSRIVTIYGSDSDRRSCSSKTLEIAEPSRCYNTSWVYYSIDNCTPPDQIPSSTISPTASASGKHTPKGAIIGGVVGGIVVLGALIGAFTYLRRRRALKREHGMQKEPPVQELGTVEKVELQAGADGEPRHELMESKSLPAELWGLRSPAEVEGDHQFAPATESQRPPT